MNVAQYGARRSVATTPDAVIAEARSRGRSRLPGARAGTAALLASLALAPPAPATAQAPAYPTRGLQIIVPFTPGTTADTLARLLGPQLAEHWHVAVVTDNRAGASGIIGTEAAARAAPDGHTLLFTATSHGTVPAFNRKLPYDPVADFAPVILLGTSAMSLVVSPQLGVSSLREFVERARKQPGAWYYSSPGTGGSQHLAMELLKQELGIDLVHVPYKGSGGALTDLMGGQVQASIVSLQTVGPHVQSGRLKLLAVLSENRVPGFPDTPTLKESGLGDLVVETWYGAFAPAQTPASIIAKLNAELNTLLRRPDIRDAMAKQGLVPAGGPPERLGALVRSEISRWTGVVNKAGIKPE